VESLLDEMDEDGSFGGRMGELCQMLEIERNELMKPSHGTRSRQPLGGCGRRVEVFFSIRVDRYDEPLGL